MAIGKRVRNNAEGIDRNKLYSLDEAVTLLKERANSRFDETVEVAMNLGVDPRRADQQVRGVVNLPHGTGKEVRVAVFARGSKAEEAQAAGADVVGAEDLAETIQGGMIKFERAIATPDMMAVVGRLGRVLGPRGLMPNPRLGTVTSDIAEAVMAAKGGQVQFRVERTGIVHAGVGKASFAPLRIAGNVRTFVNAINRAKPIGAKGIYLKKLAISSTMGPGIRLDVTNFRTTDATAAAE